MPNMSTQISDKLRRAACSFVREKMQYDLAQQLCEAGIVIEQLAELQNRIHSIK
jgi:hypothetical protein